jgi:hypothetical protein
MSGIVNKVKSALHSDHHSSSTTHGSTTTSGTAEGVAGPHSSRAANAADPRVDSDLDGSRHVGTGTTGTAGGVTGTHGTGTTGTYGTSNTTAGPHNVSLLVLMRNPSLTFQSVKLGKQSRPTCGQ